MQINREEESSNKLGCVNGSFYTIKKTDTLESIAQKAGIKLNKLLAANPYLNPNSYIAGQVIIIPAESFNVDFKNDVRAYIVGRREGLFDVLRKFNMNVVELRNMNPDVDIFNIKQGTKIVVKDFPCDKANTENIMYYSIGRNENLYSVCKKFGMTEIEMLRANANLRPSEFVEGCKICIPYTKKRD